MAFFRTFSFRFYGFVKKGHFKKWFFVEIDGSFFGIFQNDFPEADHFSKRFYTIELHTFPIFQNTIIIIVYPIFQNAEASFFKMGFSIVFSSFCKMRFSHFGKWRIWFGHFPKWQKCGYLGLIVYNLILFNMLYF